MYTLFTFRFEICGTLGDIMNVAHLLERNKIHYKISDRNGNLAREPGYLYWLRSNEVFIND